MNRPLTPPAALRLLSLLAFSGLLAAPALAVPVETELSLLVDTSGSISDTEFQLQVESYALHVRDPEVVPHDGSVALNMVFFSSTAEEVLPWTHLTDAAAADDFAEAILALERSSGSTALGDGLLTASETFADNGFEGVYTVIDVSGDGRVNSGTAIEPARTEALELVQTINGLAITDGDITLVDYFRDEVRGGPDAFVYEVLSPDTFADALRAKLRRELRRCEPPPSGTLAWFPFDETEGSVSLDVEEGHRGLHVGCPEHVEGTVDGALRFDGDGARVVVAPSPSLQVGEGDFSIMTWLRTEAWAGRQPILDTRDAETLLGWSFHLRDGRPALELADGAGESCDDDPLSACTEHVGELDVADGSWRFVAVTVDRDQPDGGRFWVDGMPAGVFDPTAAAVALDGSVGLQIGASHAGLDDSLLSGELDELGLVAAAVPEETLLAIFEAGPEGTCKWSPRTGVDAPVIDAVEGCLWPPKHRRVCIDDVRSLLPPGLGDGVEVQLSDCVSSQEEDGSGDGHTSGDCEITNDGLGLCVRVERSGRGREGRTYTATIGLSQDCGGSQLAVLRLGIPHDLRDRDCEPLEPELFLLPHEELPD